MFGVTGWWLLNYNWLRTLRRVSSQAASTWFPIFDSYKMPIFHLFSFFFSEFEHLIINHNSWQIYLRLKSPSSLLISSFLLTYQIHITHYLDSVYLLQEQKWCLSHHHHPGKAFSSQTFRVSNYLALEWDHPIKKKKKNVRRRNIWRTWERWSCFGLTIGGYMEHCCCSRVVLRWWLWSSCRVWPGGRLAKGLYVMVLAIRTSPLWLYKFHFFLSSGGMFNEMYLLG